MNRDKIFKFLTSRIVVISIIIGIILLSYFNGTIGYFTGLLLALITFWASRFKWAEFGISLPDWSKAIGWAIVFAVILFLVVDIILQPLIELVFGQVNLNDFTNVKGNLINTLVFIFLMWIAGAIGEEFMYRGFFMRRLAVALGDTDRSWLISAILISMMFGFAHLYQGMSGVISTVCTGFMFSMIFYKNRNNLILSMLTHGFYDMIGIALIYLGKERFFVDWIHSLF
ncbi:MAG: CPBP family intramembrane metalloprotease [Saprospiraceae bacterium]|uniref:CPBP family intramembrane metalloprotease n=1 Tax=Candidatus Opimibacter skivensis TaxID=2982028 RepID=A0A9D7XU60_9BACT|nr:CPBP family intramembrane metalloprotease [Candidatus Opimibacter skivensis]